MSDLHSDVNTPLAQLRMKHVDDRFQQLNGLLNSTTSAAWSYLLTVNGGAAAGLLAFIGADEKVASRSWPYLSLGLFILGLVLVGVAHAFMAHRVQGLVDQWITGSDAYFMNQITWAHLTAKDAQAVSRLSWVPWVLGWGSLGLFLAGLLVAVIGFRGIALSPIT